MEDKLRPWAVKVSHVNRFNTTERVVEEAKKLRHLRGLPGVMQGKGIPYTKDSEAYTVMRQASYALAMLHCHLHAAMHLTVMPCLCLLKLVFVGSSGQVFAGN